MRRPLKVSLSALSDSNLNDDIDVDFQQELTVAHSTNGQLCHRSNHLVDRHTWSNLH